MPAIYVDSIVIQPVDSRLVMAYDLDRVGTRRFDAGFAVRQSRSAHQPKHRVLAGEQFHPVRPKAVGAGCGGPPLEQRRTSGGKSRFAAF